MAATATAGIRGGLWWLWLVDVVALAFFTGLWLLYVIAGENRAGRWFFGRQPA